jgi:hypothetical protein
MARTTASNFASYPYEYASADADPIDPNDVWGPGKGLNFHRHVAGEGVQIPPAGLSGDVIKRVWYFAQVTD